MGISREKITMFCCYAPEDQEFLRLLERHLATFIQSGSVSLWYDTKIEPGKNREAEISLYLNQAQIILLLVSPDFMASDYCNKLVEIAMERYEQGNISIIPIILRPVHWTEAPFRRFPALPTGGKAATVSTGFTLDDAFFNIVEGIYNNVEAMLSLASTKAAALDTVPIEEAQAIKVFFCYAYADREMRKGLNKHLKALKDVGQITVWFDREIFPNTDYREEIDPLHINGAEIVLLLISPDFIDSGYLDGKEMEIAFYRRNTNNLRIIPILLRPTLWRGTKIGELDKLPVIGGPVTRWQDRDEAFINVVESLRIIFNKLLSLKQRSDQSAIHQKWMTLGWNTNGSVPVAEELLCPDGIGRYQHFAKDETGFRGTIFWYPDSDIGVHFIQGSIREKWLSLAWWEQAPIYPTSDELECSDGIGRYNHFRRIDYEPNLFYLNDFSVYSHPTLGTHEIHGAIRYHWLSLGADLYGYPTSDETTCPNGIGRFSTFKNSITTMQQIISWRQDAGTKIGPC